MKKVFTLLLPFIAACFLAKTVHAQLLPPPPLVYGASPFQDSLWAVDTSSAWQVVQRSAPSLPGFTITGTNGLAFDPCGLKTYAILKVSGVSGRVLATIDLETAVCTQVGNLGDNFSSITFDRNGQLYGVTGDGATVSETFYSIDKTNGTTTLLRALGNGADGEVICYNYASDQFYHWSGNGTVVYEKIGALSPYPITGVGGGSGETFGALYLSPNKFLISNINSNFRYVDTLANYGPLFGSLPDDLRGLAMVPAFAVSEDTVCANGALEIANGGITVHSIYYHWGDGTIDTVAAGINASHTYGVAGNYTVSVLLDNGFCTPDTFFTAPVRVNATPLVTISGSTALCPGASVTLTGSSGGSSQWYLNGSPIGGATATTYTTTAAGVYNMVKTNQNGCTDSAAVSHTLLDVPNPVVDLGNDTTVCGSLLLDAQNTGASYLWNTAAVTQTISAAATDTFSVTVTDTNGCSAADSIAVTVNVLPTVTYTESQALVCVHVQSITLTAGAPAGGSYSGTGVTGNTFGPNDAGVGTHTITYSFTDGNGCGGSATSQIEVDACGSIAENTEAMPAKLFPNPSTGMVTISFSNATWMGATLHVLDVTGRVVYQTNLQGNQTQLDLRNQSNGMYQVSIRTQGRTFTLPLIKTE